MILKVVRCAHDVVGVVIGDQALPNEKGCKECSPLYWENKVMWEYNVDDTAMRDFTTHLVHHFVD